MLEFITQPWSWWFSGFVIVSIMFALLFFGKSFGFSANLRTICAVAGLGKQAKFFDFNWKAQTWNLVFLVGAIIGGFISNQFLSNHQLIQISNSTIRDLSNLGFAEPTSILPNELFGLEFFSLKNIALLISGGTMVGFGSRYAGGCTSGHAISGLSDLQAPSLLAVVGFFIGGLTMTHLIFPLIFK